MKGLSPEKKEKAKMRDIESILEDYRQGDFRKRLNLYLFYRAFRREFSDMEEHEEISGKTKVLGTNLDHKNE
jgi:hypothetical protein